MTVVQALMHGVPVKTFDAAPTTNPSTGTVFALPARAGSLVWQTFFAVNPASITVNLEASLDMIHWDPIDSSTVVTGEVRTFSILGGKFVRGAISASSGGSGFTMMLTAQNL